MFQLKPDRKETENKTIRFPVELINSIEKVLVGKNATFRHLLFKHVSMH